MFNAWKARRQLANAKLSEWGARRRSSMARARGHGARYKLAWNQQERRARKWAHKAGAHTRSTLSRGRRSS